jgi:hypothetical protein
VAGAAAGADAHLPKREFASGELVRLLGRLLRQRGRPG